MERHGLLHRLAAAGRLCRDSRLQSESKFRRTPDDLRYVYVKSNNGQLVPLATLLNVERVTGPELVNRFNIFPAAKVLGDYPK